jgi:site-specific DNA recombinase
VQRQLSSRAVCAGEGRKTTAPASPLEGKLFDENGEALYVQGSAKGQRRYRYYVSKGLVNGGADQSETGWRLSAPKLEQTIASASAAILDDRAGIALAFEASNRDEQLPAVLKSAQAWVERLRSTTETASALADLTERVELGHAGVKLSLQLPFPILGTVDAEDRGRLALNRFVPMGMRRRGVEQRVVLGARRQPLNSTNHSSG